MSRITLNRQQIPLQRSMSALDLSRLWRWRKRFALSPRLADAFKATNGMSPEDWIMAAALVFTLASESIGGAVTLSDVPVARGGAAVLDALRAFIDANASSVHDVGKRFRSQRESVHPRFHAQIPSVFVERSIVRFDDDTFACPFPGAAMKQCIANMAQRLKGDRAYSEGFAPLQEEYVADLLDCLPGKKRMLRETELSKYVAGRICDLVIVREDEVLLVECKAAVFTRRIITSDTIADDNSTRKIIDACHQIAATITHICSGALEALGIDRSVRTEHIVITLDRVPFVDAPWYGDRYILPNVCNADEMCGENGQPRLPIVLAMDEIEELILALHKTDRRVGTLRAKKESMSYVATGEWGNFVEKEAHGVRCYDVLPFVSRDLDALRSAAERWPTA